MHLTSIAPADSHDLSRPSVPLEVPLPGRYRVALYEEYPHANLGRLVRNLVLSKARHAGALQAEALRQALLRPVSDTQEPGHEQWLRAFVLVTHDATQRIESAGVLHARLRVAVSESENGKLGIVARLGLRHSHIASRAKALGATMPATRLFAAEALRRVSFHCKDIFVLHRRPVGLLLKVEEPTGCSLELSGAFTRGLHNESWRIANWRGTPVSG